MLTLFSGHLYLCLVKVIMENTLRKIYHNPAHPGGLGSVKKLRIAVSEATGLKPSLPDVERF